MAVGRIVPRRATIGPPSYDRNGSTTRPFDPRSRNGDHMTIFQKILDGEIPCHRVYEDEHVLAFLDVAPLSPGHVLVIPKEAQATLGELSDRSAEAIGRVLPRLCRAVCSVTGATDYNVLQNNGSAAHQAVMHVHFHIIPRVGEQGLGIDWPAQDLERDAADLAASITAAANG